MSSHARIYEHICCRVEKAETNLKLNPGTPSQIAYDCKYYSSLFPFCFASAIRLHLTELWAARRRQLQSTPIENSGLLKAHYEGWDFFKIRFVFLYVFV